MTSFVSRDARVLVDFDRTLFDTSSFVEWLWEALETVYGVDAEAEKERASEFYIYSGDWYDYQFFTHLEAIPVMREVERETFIRTMLSIERPTFLFDDAQAILPRCDEIITFGNRAYQEFKLSFCPEVSDLPVTIIQESKADYVRHHYEGPLVLIDDKHLENELPDWVRFVLIDRTQTEPFMKHRDNFMSVKSLEVLTRL